MNINDYLVNKIKRGSNYFGNCKYCGEAVQWRRNKLTSHISKFCISTPSNMKESCKRKKSNDCHSEVSLTPSESISNVGSSASHRSHSMEQRSNMSSWIDKCKKEDQDQIDIAVAKFFYRTGIPFNAADCQEWKNMFQLARPAYKPPGSKKLRTTLLSRVYTDMNESIRQIIADSTNISIISDGWSNIRNEHLVNYILIIPNQKPLFYGITDCDGKSQTSMQVAADLVNVIHDIGAEKVVSIVTDNAPNMRSAWKIIEETFPHIYANGCAAHVLNLLIQDICSITKYAETLDRAISVVKFIKSRNHIAVAFRKIQQNHDFKRFVTLPVITRWYTQYQCLNNLINNREVIEQISATTSLMKRVNDGDKRDAFNGIVRDSSFWSDVEVLQRKLKLPSELIGEAEGDASNIGSIYKLFQKLLCSNNFGNEELLLIKKRWDFIHTESMGFAYILDPMTKGGLGMMGTDFEDTHEQFLLKYDDKQEICDEFIKFMSYVAEPGEKASQYFSRKNYNIRSWWMIYGRNKFPELSKIASRLYAIPTSSASAERVWSVFSLIHTKKRCKLKNETVFKLAYVYINTQLISDYAMEGESIDYFLQQLNDEEFSFVDDLP